MQLLLRDPRLPGQRAVLKLPDSATLQDLAKEVIKILGLKDDQCNFDLVFGIAPNTTVVSIPEDDSDDVDEDDDDDDDDEEEDEEDEVEVGDGQIRRRRGGAKKQPPSLAEVGIVPNDTIRVQDRALTGTQAQGKGKLKAPKKKKADNTTSATNKKKKSGVRSTAGSEEDIAEHLLSALNGGSTGRDKALRNVFRSALEGRYNESKSISRVGSLENGSYSFAADQSVRLLGNGEEEGEAEAMGLKRVVVTYPEGDGTRARVTHEDRVELVPRGLLAPLIQVLLEQDQESREALKPVNLAKASPRIFWTMVHHFGPDIVAGFKTLFPLKDFSWLSERRRALSEKAKRNKEQEEREEEELLQQGKAPSKRGKKASATSASIHAPAQASAPAPASASSSGSASASTSAPAPVLGAHLGVRARLELEPQDMATISRLCAVDMGVVCDEDKYATVAASCGGSSLFHLADCIEPPKFAALRISLKSLRARRDEAENLIAAAQEQLVVSVFFGMICGGSRALVRALRAIKVDTPKQMRCWLTVSPDLRKLILANNAALSSLPLFRRCVDEVGGESDEVKFVDAGVTEARVEWMTRMSQAFIERCEWAENWTYPEAWEEEEEEEEAGGEEEDDLNSWKLDAVWKTSGAEFLGKNVRFVYEDSVSKLWLEGTVVAYAPPVEADDVALWKVCYRSAREPSRDLYQDLERHEVVAAVARTP